jgi:hypothetical protein
MRKLFTLFTLVCLIATLRAQSPQKMSYQAVIRNSTDVLVCNQLVGMRISILHNSSNGTAIYVERQTPTTNANGLSSIEIGGGTVISGLFSNIDWVNGTYFIKTETDPSGGTNYITTTTSQILSTPYALYAAKAGTSLGVGNFNHYIGENFGGGIIFHLWKDTLGVEHGLIVDLTTISLSSTTWSNISYTTIGLSAQSLWDGLSNSNAIVSQPGHTYSIAALCLNSTNGGQNDWYLPSIQEIQLLWNNFYEVERALEQNPYAMIIGPSFYMSSTELSDHYVMSFNFSYGSSSNSEKGGTGYARAVRAF